MAAYRPPSFDSSSYGTSTLIGHDAPISPVSDQSPPRVRVSDDHRHPDSKPSKSLLGLKFPGAKSAKDSKDKKDKSKKTKKDKEDKDDGQNHSTGRGGYGNIARSRDAILAAQKAKAMAMLAAEEAMYNAPLDRPALMRVRAQAALAREEAALDARLFPSRYLTMVNPNGPNKAKSSTSGSTTSSIHSSSAPPSSTVGSDDHHTYETAPTSITSSSPEPRDEPRSPHRPSYSSSSSSGSTRQRSGRPGGMHSSRDSQISTVDSVLNVNQELQRWLTLDHTEEEELSQPPSPVASSFLSVEEEYLSDEDSGSDTERDEDDEEFDEEEYRYQIAIARQARREQDLLYPHGLIDPSSARGRPRASSQSSTSTEILQQQYQAQNDHVEMRREPSLHYPRPMMHSTTLGGGGGGGGGGRYPGSDPSPSNSHSGSSGSGESSLGAHQAALNIGAGAVPTPPQTPVLRSNLRSKPSQTQMYSSHHYQSTPSIPPVPRTLPVAQPLSSHHHHHHHNNSSSSRQQQQEEEDERAMVEKLQKLEMEKRIQTLERQLLEMRDLSLGRTASGEGRAG